MRLNSKGQVTIPAALRAKHGLHPGDEVDIVEVGSTLQIQRREGSETRGERAVRLLRGSGGHSGMTTDEIMAMWRGE